MEIKNASAAGSAPMESDHGYAATFAARLVARYCAVLSEQNPDTATVLAQKLALQQLPDKPARMAGYVALWQALDADAQYALAVADAKLSQLARTARTMATTDIVQAHNAVKAETAGSIDFVLEKFRAQNVSAADCQQFIDENAVAWFSLTGHPTNPTTVDYVEAQTALARTLADPAATAQDLEAVLKTVYETPIVAAPKSPLDEARETLNTLDVLYDAALGMKKLFDAALQKHDYAAEGVRVRNRLIHPCVWTLGDGDGNANMTAAVLEDGIALHRRRIAARYADSFAAAAQTLTALGEGDALVQALRDLAQQPQKITQSDLQKMAKDCQTAEGAAVIEDLAFLYACFGAGFGTIDVRHNARDIMATMSAVLRAAGMAAEDFATADADADAQAHMLAAWLKDAAVTDTLSAVTVDDLAADETAARIYGRLQVIGRHPDMCEKLIIAETTHPAHALAALLLLKITGSVVGAAGSQVDLTVLSESVADLATLGDLIKFLLADDTFRAHVVARGQVVVMIAKSDTTRQDGRGEAEYAQYRAAVDAYAALAEMQKQFADLAAVRISIKNGGGHALQRGGGRVTEIPMLHGRAAADAGVPRTGPSTLTIQGQQMMILFCPGKTAIGTLEALAAQNLYTRAGVAGQMPPPMLETGIDKTQATADAKTYAAAAGAAFDALTKDSIAVDDLLTAAPWLAMKAGNASSRPAKRGEKPVVPGVTPREAKGDNPKALQGRAISGERLTAHACLPVFSVLGLREAMAAVENRAPGALHHLYRAHKIHRDAARATISALAMADFDIAWPLLAGTPRPAAAQVAALAEGFDPAARPPSKEHTLAYLEQYFLDVEKMTFAMITGRAAPAGLQHGTALQLLWPDLGAQVARRDRSAEFSRVIECRRTRDMDAAPDTPVAEQDFRITQALYTAANVVNTPVGILATRTRLEPAAAGGDMAQDKGRLQPESYLEQSVRESLRLPPCLA